MDYIINPSWFYWIEVADYTKGIAFGVAIILIIAVIVLAIMAKMSADFNEEKEAKVLLKVLLYCLIGLAVSSAVAIFVPSKKTLMEMQIARLATRSNVEFTIAQVKEIVDYIINAMKELK